MCQQCRPDHDDCGAGKSCNSGRCEAIPGFCNKNGDCPSGLCEKGHCAACVQDKHCPGGTRCSAGKCEADNRKPCKHNDECAETEDCVSGRCTPIGGKRYVTDGSCKLEPILFGYNEFELNPGTTGAVDRNAECVKKNSRPVNLIGRTDPRGTPEYNLALSDKRAQAVKRRLRDLGIPDQNMFMVPRGEMDSTGTDETTWSQDRRVEVNFR
jgi:peptidoglycan-associated lipoprotein